MRRSRWVLALGSIVCCASCRPARTGGPPPRAIVVASLPGLAATGHSAPPPARGVEEIAPFEMVLGSNRVCARIAGHIHCTHEPSPDSALASTPPLPGIDDAVSLALGRGFGCAATRDGGILCFGDNEYGQLGGNLRAPRSDKPIAVVGISGARRVVAGDRHACALLRDGTVRCWGNNDHGQTGSATHYLPAARELVSADVVEGLSDVIDVAAGATATCALDSAHRVTCWGRDTLPGHGGSMSAPKNGKPTQIAALSGVDDLSAGGDAFCGTRRGELLCWGETRSLVAGSIRRTAKQPTFIAAARARRVRVARGHACAVLRDGAITCWGNNYDGALGRGETKGLDALPPQVVKGIPFAVDVAVGGSMSCAITGSRAIYCWGSLPRAGHAPRKEPAPVEMRLAD